METTKKQWSFFLAPYQCHTLAKKWDLQTCYMHLEIASNCHKTWQQLSIQVVWVWAHLAVANTWGWEDQGLQLQLLRSYEVVPTIKPSYWSCSTNQLSKFWGTTGHHWAPAKLPFFASANFRPAIPRFFCFLRLARRLLPCAAPAKLEAAWSSWGPHPARSADLLNTSPGMVMDWSPAASRTSWKVT